MVSASPLNLQVNHTGISPNQWFAERYPLQTKQYGAAFLQSVEEHQGWKLIRLQSINQQFFAAILGGVQRLGHRVVYLRDSACFFFKDADGLFKPTTEQKLQTYLACLLMKCAEEMPATVDRQKLIVDYRTPDRLKQITYLARSILEVSNSFFDPKNGNIRINAPESHHSVARFFLVQTVQEAEQDTVTLNDLYDHYVSYCRSTKVDGVQRNEFKKLISETVREEFGVALRHDLRDDAGKWRRGWKGLKLKNDRFQLSMN